MGGDTLLPRSTYRSDSSDNGIRPKRTRNKAKNSHSAESGSLLFTLLAIGVLFCMADVFYIMHYITQDRHQLNSGTTTDISTSTQNQNSDAHTDSNPIQKQHPVVDAVNPEDTIQEEAKNDAKDKEPILNLLREAKIENLDAETLEKLPSWSDVTALYGSEPVYVGLETCQVFRESGTSADHFVSVAGTFNTGTNLMAELLINNCHMPERMKKYGRKNRGVRWQVTWGKHNDVSEDLESFRTSHQTYNDTTLIAENIFPAVTVRDPYKWMASMCRHSYGAKWPHVNEHCPNLVPNDIDREHFPELQAAEAVNVTIAYASYKRHHESLAGFFNDWYNAYVRAKFPRLLVRFEDLIFHPKEVTKTVCECAGGEMNSGPFHFIVESAKKGDGAHGKERTTYVDALVKYGTEKGRYSGFTKADLKYVQNHLDPKLMELFGYKYAPDSLLE